MSIRLYVGNLPKEDVDRNDLQAIFAEYGDSVNTKVIKDRKTGKCRGFAFVTVPTDEIADQVIEKFNGYTFGENELKIEKALPRTKEKEENSEQPEATETENKAPNVAPAKKRAGGKSRRGEKATPKAASSGGGGGSTQPDPRWADELSKLKEMLAAQGTNT